jgi:Fe-S cluster biogenesis protein NfuA
MNSPPDLKSRVMKFLADDVAPLLQMDGGYIELVDVQDGIAQVRLHGSCGACPTSILAVIMGMEQELRRRIPEIEYLEVVPNSTDTSIGEFGDS